MNRIVNVILRPIVNRLVRSGIGRGADAIVKRGNGAVSASKPAATRIQNDQDRKRTRQAIRMVRRISRF
ncbi:MAG: hypothetical protein AAF982_13285 [Pseudomonadota bacterium]